MERLYVYEVPSDEASGKKKPLTLFGLTLF